MKALKRKKNINEYYYPDYFDFATHVCTINHENPVIMASLDIKSLFTNITLKETMDICTHGLFENTVTMYITIPKTIPKTHM